MLIRGQRLAILQLAIQHLHGGVRRIRAQQASRLDASSERRRICLTGQNDELTARSHRQIAEPAPIVAIKERGIDDDIHPSLQAALRPFEQTGVRQAIHLGRIQIAFDIGSNGCRHGAEALALHVGSNAQRAPLRSKLIAQPGFTRARYTVHDEQHGSGAVYIFGGSLYPRAQASQEIASTGALVLRADAVDHRPDQGAIHRIKRQVPHAAVVSGAFQIGVQKVARQILAAARHQIHHQEGRIVHDVDPA